MPGIAERVRCRSKESRTPHWRPALRRRRRWADKRSRYRLGRRASPRSRVPGLTGTNRLHRRRPLRPGFFPAIAWRRCSWCSVPGEVTIFRPLKSFGSVIGFSVFEDARNNARAEPRSPHTTPGPTIFPAKICAIVASADREGPPIPPSTAAKVLRVAAGGTHLHVEAVSW